MSITTRAANAGTQALRLECRHKIYSEQDTQVVALDDVTLSLPAGSFTAVMGPSGSGKSDFLICAAGLEQPSRVGA